MAENQNDAPRVATQADLDEWARIVADPANLVCTCAVTGCAYHGDCKRCVALHRYYRGYPGCTRDFAKEFVENYKG
jgi:hypothetical protein